MKIGIHRRIEGVLDLWILHIIHALTLEETPKSLLRLSYVRLTHLRGLHLVAAYIGLAKVAVEKLGGSAFEAKLLIATVARAFLVSLRNEALTTGAEAYILSLPQFAPDTNVLCLQTLNLDLEFLLHARHHDLQVVHTLMVLLRGLRVL